MAVEEKLVRTERIYAAGVDLDHARERLENTGGEDTAQEAYTDIGYFDMRDETYEVYEFLTTTTITMVNPPY